MGSFKQLRSCLCTHVVMELLAVKELFVHTCSDGELLAVKE